MPFETRPAITCDSFRRAAAALHCDVAAIQAVCEVEAPDGGFDSTGRPRILFEGHVFSRLTGGRYDKTAPTLSYPRWVRTHYAQGLTPDLRNAGEHMRLDKAVQLDRSAALQSASWGKFQILGQNYEDAGFPSVQAFVNAMYADEDAHLAAFVEIIRAWGLAPALRAHDWTTFARRYNGKDYAANRYDSRMSDAYDRISGATAAGVA